MYKTYLVDENDSQRALNTSNRILKNETVAVTLKYLSNLWQSLEMPLNNFKIELKLKWASDCVLAALGIDNVSANENNIIFTIKNAKLYRQRQSKTIKNS